MAGTQGTPTFNKTLEMGNHFAHYVNGVPTVEFIDRDEKDTECKRRVDVGILALQLHGGHAMQVHFTKGQSCESLAEDAYIFIPQFALTPRQYSTER